MSNIFKIGVDHMPGIPSVEKEAALQLSKRPPHVSGFLSEEEIQQHKESVESFPQVAPTEDSGTAAPIRWQPYFKWVNSVWVNHRDDASREPKILHIYGHWDDDFLYFTGHREDYLRFRSRDSNAKIMLSASSKNHSGDDSGCIFINSLNASGAYRFGSAFIQLAIEYSLMAGFAGKVRLNSTRDSGLFYFKLGFVPVCEDTFQRLKNGERVNGGEMYLPQASIDLWKSKIGAHSILPNPLYIPKASLHMPGKVDVSQMQSSSSPPEPPSAGNKEKIRQLVNGLIKNIECKNNNRASWFDYGSASKIGKLKAVESWLSSNHINSIDEKKILSLIRDISSIKRNPFGFFAPHSLMEFNEAIHQNSLQCSEKLHFDVLELDYIKEQSDITYLLSTIV